MESSAYLKIRNDLNFAKKNSVTYLNLIFDFALVGVACFFSGRGPAGEALAAILLACLMFRGFSVMHEAVHGIAHSRKAANECLGHIFGVLSFLPYSQWKEIHLQHHLWSGNLDRDPTMKIIKNFKDTRVKPTYAQEFAWRWWLPYLAFRQQVVFWQQAFAIRDQGKSRRSSAIWLELFGVMAYVGALSCYFGAGTSIGAIVAYLFLVELVNFPHHLGLKQSSGMSKLSPRDQHRVARSVVYFKPFNRFVLLNFNYHVEHHLFPTLPWYRLESAHDLIRKELSGEFNLCHGNGWLKDSRQMSLLQVLEQSVPSSESLEESKLVA